MTLHLTLKKKWFDMIASGEKTEEYRELKKHWISRLTTTGYPEEYRGENKTIPDNMEFDFKNHNPQKVMISYMSQFKEFDTVTLTNGYRKDSPKMVVECLGIDIGPAVPDWSDNAQGDYFRIKLGKIITKQ